MEWRSDKPHTWERSNPNGSEWIKPDQNGSAPRIDCRGSHRKWPLLAAREENKLLSGDDLQGGQRSREREAVEPSCNEEGSGEAPLSRPSKTLKNIRSLRNSRPLDSLTFVAGLCFRWIPSGFFVDGACGCRRDGVSVGDGMRVLASFVPSYRPELIQCHCL